MSEYTMNATLNIFTVRDRTARQWLQSLNISFGKPYLIMFEDAVPETPEQEAGVVGAVTTPNQGLTDGLRYIKERR